MHTIVETAAYLRAAAEAGLSDEERTAIVDMLAANPAVGDLIQGTGGVRKLRVAGRGKGKSGGYRVIFFHHSEELPVFLLTVFSKGDRANISKAERHAFEAVTIEIVRSYRHKFALLAHKAKK